MWTALSLWLACGAGLAVYVALAVRGIAAGGHMLPWIVAVPILYFGAILAICAIYFIISWIWRARRPPGVRLNVRRTLALWWHEYLTLAGAMPRLMLYGLLVRDPPSARIGVPVLLVHGVLCNAGVWWRLARYLRENGVGGIYSLSYGPPLASIESFAEQLAKKVDAIVAATGAAKILIVAHSMGGLVARTYMRAYGSDRIERVVTIGTPHHGSVLAWICPGASLAQMRPGNPWLAALNEVKLDGAPRFVSLWSWHDSMVAPQTSSELRGAAEVRLAGIGHNALLGDRRVFELVSREVDDARRMRR